MADCRVFPFGIYVSYHGSLMPVNTERLVSQERAFAYLYRVAGTYGGLVAIR